MEFEDTKVEEVVDVAVKVGDAVVSTGLVDRVSVLVYLFMPYERDRVGEKAGEALLETCTLKPTEIMSTTKIVLDLFSAPHMMSL
jgi:hypothetical protein